MLRIIGGSLRGRRFPAPAGRQTRPTGDKVREAIFNTLGPLVDWEDLRVLDLFAGSGALGLEALSRGAAHCTFVESHTRTAAAIRTTAERLGLPATALRVMPVRVESWLRSAQPAPGARSAAGLVLADPPYAYAEHDQLLAALAAAPIVADGAVIVLETAAGHLLEPPARLEVLRLKGYGDTQVCVLNKRPSATSAEASLDPSPEPRA